MMSESLEPTVEDRWALEERSETSLGTVAHGRIGSGPPVVLVHGTPSWSFLWRHVARRLAGSHTVFLYDLPGYGDSATYEGQDVSISSQAKVLIELLQKWALVDVPVVGHDIGGAIVVGAHVLHQAPLSAIVLLDSVITAPWITPTTRHQKRWIEAYRTMPAHIYERVALGHLSTAFYNEPLPLVIDAYLEHWRGPKGQAAWYRKIEQFDESYSDEIVPSLRQVTTPVHVLWGEHDRWMPRSVAESVLAACPEGTSLEFIPNAGHFAPEDNPEVVAESIARFVGSQPRRQSYL